MATIDLVDYWDFVDQTGNIHTFDCTNYAYASANTGTFTIAVQSPTTRKFLGRDMYKLYFVKGDTNPTRMYWNPMPWSADGASDCVWYVEAWRSCLLLNTEWIFQWAYCWVPYTESIDSGNPPLNMTFAIVEWPLCPWAHNSGPSHFSKRYLDTVTGFRLDLTDCQVKSGKTYTTVAGFGVPAIDHNWIWAWYLDIKYVGDSYTCGSYTGKTVRVRTRDFYPLHRNPSEDRVMIEDWYIQEGRGVVQINQCYLGTWQGVVYSNPAFDYDDLHLHDKGGSNPLDDNNCGIVATCSSIA